MLDVIYSLWVDDFGLLVERHKVREALDSQLATAAFDAAVAMGRNAPPQTEEHYEQSQRELMAMFPPAAPRRGTEEKETPTKEDVAT